MAKRMLKATAVGSISALALAAMAGTASAQDDAGINAYGFIHGSATYHDNDDDSMQFGASGTGSEGNLPSRFGVRGNMDLAPGITGVAQLELGVTDRQSDAGLYTRLANAGLQFDNVGTLRVGSQWTQHYLWTTVQTDIFTGAHHVRAAPAQTIFRRDNMAQFTSADFNGFQFALGGEAVRGSRDVGYEINHETGALEQVTANPAEDDEIDVLHVAARYGIGPVELGASMADEQWDGGKQTIAGAATYDAGVVAISAVVSQEDVDGGDDWVNMEAAVSVPVAEAWTLKGKVSQTAEEEYTGADADDVIGYGVEAAYDFGNGAQAYVGMGDDDEDDADNMIASTGVVVQF